AAGGPGRAGADRGHAGPDLDLAEWARPEPGGDCPGVLLAGRGGGLLGAGAPGRDAAGRLARQHLNGALSALSAAPHPDAALPISPEVSQVECQVAARLGAADQHAAIGRIIDRVRSV